MGVTTSRNSLPIRALWAGKVGCPLGFIPFLNFSQRSSLYSLLCLWTPLCSAALSAIRVGPKAIFVFIFCRIEAGEGA